MYAYTMGKLLNKTKRLYPVHSNISYVSTCIDHELFSTVILLPSAESFKKGCCQLRAKVCAQITGKLLVQACPGKVWLGELTAAMTIAVDLRRKATKQTRDLGS